MTGYPRGARSTPLSTLLVGLAVGACGDATAPVGDVGAPVQFAQEISMAQLEEALRAGAQRVEIKLRPDGSLVAREVEVKSRDELSDREEIESRITAIDPTGGTLVLALGGLVVAFDGGTEFRSEGRANLTRDEFVARVQDALTQGREPAVEAKRPPPSAPQAPDDPTFVATRLELDDEADDPEIELNVDGDNLIANDAPPPDGWIAVLGLRIELRVTEGITELEAEDDDVRGETEFEGLVASVDIAGRRFTLRDGTVVRLVDGTRTDDDDDGLSSLEAVAEALADGQLVEAEGKAIVETAEPRVLIAIEVEFEIEDDPDDVPGEELED
jgi:hypothetical protein